MVCFISPGILVVWQELARIPTAPVFWEKQEACRYLISLQREWLSFWPFTQNLKFFEPSSQGGEAVHEAGDQLRRELTRGSSFLSHPFWLLFSLEMSLLFLPLESQICILLGVLCLLSWLLSIFQKLSKLLCMNSTKLWTCSTCACHLGCIVITSSPWLWGQIFILNEVYPS